MMAYCLGVHLMLCLTNRLHRPMNGRADSQSLEIMLHKLPCVIANIPTAILYQVAKSHL